MKKNLKHEEKVFENLFYTYGGKVLAKLHMAIKKALAKNNASGKKVTTKRFLAREIADWIEWIDTIEDALKNKNIKFKRIE